jgi:hypothetical protein
MSRDWRRDFEIYRPWGLLRWGLMGIILGLLAVIQGGPIWIALGVAIGAFSLLSMAKGVRLLRRRRDDV